MKRISKFLAADGVLKTVEKAFDAVETIDFKDLKKQVDGYKKAPENRKRYFRNQIAEYRFEIMPLYKFRLYKSLKLNGKIQDLIEEAHSILTNGN